MLTVLEIVKKTTEFFTAKGIESPRLNAELLVGHGLGLQRMQLYLQFERLLNEAELEKIRPLVRRRGQREPLQYIVGETDFHGLKLRTDRRALIPRPETERLVELIVTRATTAPGQILDLGTGTGAIGLALAQSFPGAHVTGVDKSPDALALAKENAEKNGLGGRVSWIQSDWYSDLPRDARFALIVSNPPYLSAGETAEAPPEVREFEPAAALVSGGADGLDDLREIVRRAPEFLADGGTLALETGIAQHATLRELTTTAGFSRTESLPDLTGRDRYVIATR